LALAAPCWEEEGFAAFPTAAFACTELQAIGTHLLQCLQRLSLTVPSQGVLKGMNVTIVTTLSLAM